MIILKFWGGIGNQLFIYALYTKLKKIGKDVRADMMNYTSGVDIRKYELDKLGIRVKTAKLADYWTIQKNLKSKLDFIRTLHRKDDYSVLSAYVEKQHMFDSKVFEEDNTCLMGYWQDPKYFLDVLDDVKKDIVFPKFDAVGEEVSRMRHQESVSIHVRLTDYQVGINKRLGNVCSRDYYNRAIECIRKRVTNPVFYVFSDDTDGAKALLENELQGDCHFIEPGDDIRDLYLMTNCKHHIIANSSYSWWGACLGISQDGVVIAPNRWITDCDDWDPTLDSWIKIKSSEMKTY